MIYHQNQVGLKQQAQVYQVKKPANNAQTSRNNEQKTMALSKVVANVGADSQRSNDYLRIKRANGIVSHSMVQGIGQSGPSMAN